MLETESSFLTVQRKFEVCAFVPLPYHLCREVNYLTSLSFIPFFYFPSSPPLLVLLLIFLFLFLKLLGLLGCWMERKMEKMKARWVFMIKREGDIQKEKFSRGVGG